MAKKSKVKNKAKPYSDEELRIKLRKELNIICSREAVTKYRKELKIDNSRSRKETFF